MSAVEDYNRVAAREREWNKTHHSHVIERLADTADAALAEETARADRAEALLRYVLMQDMEHGDRGREPLDGLIERLGAFMDAEVQP